MRSLSGFRALYVVGLVLSDLVMLRLAFVLAYHLRIFSESLLYVHPARMRGAGGRLGLQGCTSAYSTNCLNTSFHRDGLGQTSCDIAVFTFVLRSTPRLRVNGGD